MLKDDLRMEKLSRWHIASNTVVEIRLSPLPKENMHICRSNAVKKFFLVIIFIVIGFVYTFTGSIIFRASDCFVISIGER